MPEPTNLAVHRLRRERPYDAARPRVKTRRRSIPAPSELFRSAATLARLVSKKTRTPAPPRPVQAPQRRTGKPPSSGGNRRTAYIVGLAVLALIAVGAVLAFVMVSGGSSKSTGGSVAEAMRAAGCTYQDVKAPTPPNGEGQHIQTLKDKVDWNTYPPAGGQHYGLWAVWGFYTDPVNPKQVVHNEEHGGIVLWWGPKTPKSTVDKLQAFYSKSPNSMFGTPLGTINGKSLGSKVAVTAWTGNSATYQRSDWGTQHLAICPTFNESAFTKFRDAYRGQGPEGIPTSQNNPGMGPG